MFITIIIVLINYMITLLKNYEYYPINEYLEKIHTIYIFFAYCFYLIMRILQMLLENREDFRYRFVSLINLVLNNSKFQAITINLSPSGACIYTPIDLYEGQHLKLFKHSLPYPYKDAFVRWYDKRNKKAGIMFINKK